MTEEELEQNEQADPTTPQSPPPLSPTSPVEVTALNAALAAKADADALEAAQATLETVQAGLGSTGRNLRVVTGYYSGKGKYGSSNRNTLTFDFSPMLVMVGTGAMLPMVLFRSCGEAKFYAFNSWNDLSVLWGSQSVSWYSTVSAQKQLNENIVLYHYIALGCDD